MCGLLEYTIQIKCAIQSVFVIIIVSMRVPQVDCIKYKRSKNHKSLGGEL